jgi:hypothetical protein
MNRKVILVAGGALAAIAIAIAIAVPVVTAGGHPDPEFRVFKNATAAQAPPLPAEASDKVNGKAARLVAQHDGVNVYLAPGTESGSVCLVADDPSGMSVGCFTEETVKNRVTYLGWALGDTAGEVSIAVPVPDAYTDVEVDGKKLKAKNNVAVVKTKIKKGEIRLSGDSGTLSGTYALGG